MNCTYFFCNIFTFFSKIINFGHDSGDAGSNNDIKSTPKISIVIPLNQDIVLNVCELQTFKITNGQQLLVQSPNFEKGESYDAGLNCTLLINGQGISTCPVQTICNEMDLRETSCEDEFLGVSGVILGKENKFCGPSGSEDVLFAEMPENSIKFHFKSSNDGTFNKVYKGFQCNVSCDPITSKDDQLDTTTITIMTTSLIGDVIQTISSFEDQEFEPNEEPLGVSTVSTSQPIIPTIDEKSTVTQFPSITTGVTDEPLFKTSEKQKLNVETGKLDYIPPIQPAASWIPLNAVYNARVTTLNPTFEHSIYSSVEEQQPEAPSYTAMEMVRTNSNSEDMELEYPTINGANNSPGHQNCLRNPCKISNFFRTNIAIKEFLHAESHIAPGSRIITFKQKDLDNQKWITRRESPSSNAFAILSLVRGPHGGLLALQSEIEGIFLRKFIRASNQFWESVPVQNPGGNDNDGYFLIKNAQTGDYLRNYGEGKQLKSTPELYNDVQQWWRIENGILNVIAPHVYETQYN